MTTIKFRRGVFASIPTLAAGEPGWASDTQDLYIGTGSGNIKFAKQASDVSFGNIISSGWGVFPSGIRTTTSGGSSGYIWAVSGQYSNYGIYCHAGTPTFMEWHWAGVIKFKINMETGELIVPKLTIGSDSIQSLKLDDMAEPDDTEDLNTSAVRHGLIPRLSGHGAEAFTGDGAWLRLYDSTSIIIKILSKVSDTTRNSNDAEKYHDGAWIKIKETKLGEPTGKMRIHFEFKSDSGKGVYARIYKRGDPLGAEQFTTEVTYQERDEDLGPFAAQDLIQIYVKSDPGDQVYVRNLRFKYDRSINWLGECVLDVPIVIKTQNPFSMQNQD